MHDFLVSFSRQNCGVKTIEAHGRIKRVIGGYTSKMNSWPWIVNMIDKDSLRQYCSGVIIDEKWILTVAHCFIYYGDNRTTNATSLPVTKYKYLIADHMYNVTDPYEFSVEPAQLFIHPKYKLGNDMHPGKYKMTKFLLLNCFECSFFVIKKDRLRHKKEIILLKLFMFKKFTIYTYCFHVCVV